MRRVYRHRREIKGPILNIDVAEVCPRRRPATERLSRIRIVVIGISIDVKIGIAPGKGTMGSGRRTLDEVVSDDIGIALPRGEPAFDERVQLPVVNNVVDELDDALRLRIPAVVVDEEVVAEGDIFALTQRSESLRRYSLAYDRVLKRDVGALIHVQRIPPTPLNRDVIENHVSALKDRDSALSFLTACGSLTEANIANDHIIGPAERDFVSPGRNSIPGCRLAGDRNIAPHTDGRPELDVAPDVEDDDARPATDGIAERA